MLCIVLFVCGIVELFGERSVGWRIAKSLISLECKYILFFSLL